MEGGTGVYYQAMPAVGPDGKNVMKLIPVQKVNGHFYQTAFHTDKDDVDLQQKSHAKPVQQPAVSSPQAQSRIPSLQPTADGRYVLKTLPEVRTVSNSVKTQPTLANNFNINTQKQARVPLVMKSASEYVVHLPPQPSRQGNAVVQTLPVTVKSPVLPSGHFLQIPPNAKVRTLPATALPQSIKCRILNSVNNTPNLEKSPPTVVLVSPVNSVKINSDQVVSHTKPSQIKNTSQNLPPNLQTPVCSPKTNEDVNAPIKWVVQEGTGTSAPCLIPVSTPNVNSDRNKTAKQFNFASTANEISPNRPTPPQTGQEKITPGKDNSLVMYNGKVYLVAKKNSEIAKGVISEVGKQGLVSISPALPDSSALASNSSKHDPKNINVSEVIDLCDDDEETSTCLGGSPGNLPTPSQTEVDESDEESNVIFVSYIPPKSGEKEATAASLDTPEEPVEGGKKSVSQNEGDLMAHAEMEKSCADNFSATSDEVMDEQVRETETAEINTSSLSESVNIEDDKEMDGENPLETECQDDGAVAENESVLEEPHNICVQATDYTETVFENPAPVQKTQPKSDCQLRKEFGIIYDVQICLKRTKPTVKPDQLERLIINKRTLDGLRKVIQESKLQSKIREMVSYTNTEEDKGLKVKRIKQDQDGSQDTPSITTHVSPFFKCLDDPMENDLISPICQDVCSETESTADKVQSEMSADCNANTCCLTSSPKQRTASDSLSPSSASKRPPRSKKGKVCTACPCGVVLGAAGATSPQEKPSPCTVESNKGTQQSCSNKSQESCQLQSKNPCKKLEMKCLLRSPHKGKSPLESLTTEMSHDISPNCSVDITSNVSSSYGLPDCSNRPALSSPGTECRSSASSSTDTETSRDDTSLDQSPSNKPCTSFSKQRPGPKMDKFPTQTLYSLEAMDAEEIKRRERIERLKDLLREREAALEHLQRSMNV